MSWDEINITTKDILGAKALEHPVQMIMSADRIRRTDRFPTEKVWRCRHSRTPLYAPDFAFDPPIDYETEIVDMFTIQHSWLEQWYAQDFGEFIIAPRRFIFWVQGLCSCGTLYWHEGGEFREWSEVFRKG